ncbi:hypothetical protein KSP39_PZI000005 [Platanthera zijinensis]|uniref:Uncharacterized protein n=1 Tax=Platanthera zijinensis TaxID=2320716 RepID=A0AAP0C2D9_9ASPA
MRGLQQRRQGRSRHFNLLLSSKRRWRKISIRSLERYNIPRRRRRQLGTLHKQRRIVHRSEWDLARRKEGERSILFQGLSDYVEFGELQDDLPHPFSTKVIVGESAFEKETVDLDSKLSILVEIVEREKKYFADLEGKSNEREKGL